MKSYLEEARLADARRDGSHAFVPSTANDIDCAQCGKPRWAHVIDGHVCTPSRTFGMQEIAHSYKRNYRQHPNWDKPGTVRYKPDNQTKPPANRK